MGSNPGPLFTHVRRKSALGMAVDARRRYVNDMELAVKCKLLLYADDSVLLASDKDPKVISEMLSENLETCNDWLKDNWLSLHLGKTEAMICGKKYKKKKKRRISSSV